ncbi:MAG: hypothetical protein A2Y86_03735 [Candidatus Aminicenantes bacterium RBG_13_62_12]|nr:MAG: hypothetical protein A2Y86_03735 [Candidatus Aminicenantes bacterium RBG_13_62_12]
MLFSLCLFSPAPGFPLSSPQVDPFYLKALADGEMLLAAGDSADAVLRLEIAVFGLQNDRPNLLKALGTYALAAYKSGKIDKAREAVGQLTGLIGQAGLAEVGLREAWKTDLAKLAAYFAGTPAEAERTPGIRVRTISRPKAEADKKAGPEDAGQKRLAELEKRAKSERGNTEALLELHGLQLRLGDTRAAKKTLEKLVREVPREPRGHYLLGKILYAERKFKHALGRFEKALSLSGEEEAESPQFLTGLGYSILSLNYLGRRPDVREKCPQFIERAPEEWISRLDMGERDRAVLRNILAPYYKAREDEKTAGSEAGKTETGKKEEAAPPLLQAGKKEERRSPVQTDAAARAYGVFDQYLQDNDPASARRTLERLLNRYPSEVRAVFLLARLEYRQGKFEEARERFQAVIRESRQNGDAEGLLAEAAAYLVLCLRETKGHEAAGAAALLYRRDLEGAVLDGLGLEGVDKQLIRDYLSGRRDAAVGERTLDKVIVQETGEGLRIEIVCLPKTAFRTFVLERDRKIIVDLFNVSRILSERVIPVSKRGVQAVRTGMFQENTARVVLDIQGDVPEYVVRETESGLAVLIR